MKKYKNKSNIDIVKDYLAGNRPFVQVGYTRPTMKRKVGEQWTDNNGITWEQRKGYKARVNKQADIIRKASKRICKCGKDLNFADKLDDKFYSKTGKCFDCIIKEETEYRILGVFGAYEKWKLLSNYYGFLLDMKNKVIDSIKYLEQEDTKCLEVLCNSEGYLEKFQGLNTTQLLEAAKKDLDEINKAIAIVAKDKEELREMFETALADARSKLPKPA